MLQNALENIKIARESGILTQEQATRLGERLLSEIPAIAFAKICSLIALVTVITLIIFILSIFIFGVSDEGEIPKLEKNFFRISIIGLSFSILGWVVQALFASTYTIFR